MFCNLDATMGITRGGQGGHNSLDAESLWGHRKVSTMLQVLS